MGLSIHTPARGVTSGSKCRYSFRDSFNPHSRKGSDGQGGCIFPIKCAFNPHSRKGSDCNNNTDTNRHKPFNPHSRKGSDIIVLLSTLDTATFNPHSRKGSDSLPMPGIPSPALSIHTPARGVTLGWTLCIFSYCAFNPHSRKGSDIADTCIEIRLYPFNPHSRKGSDSLVRDIMQMQYLSIHTPARGVTVYRWFRWER